MARQTTVFDKKPPKSKLDPSKVQMLLPFVLDYDKKRPAIEHIARLYEVDYLLELWDSDSGRSYVWSLLDEHNIELTEFTPEEYYQKFYEMTTLYQTTKVIGDDGKQRKDYGFKSPRAERVFACGQNWFFNQWTNARSRETTTINHCYDMQCPLCNELKANARITKNMPMLEKLAQEYDLYHMVVTQSNNSLEELGLYIDLIKKNLIALFDILSGENKIKGLDLSCYGYAGALRNIECTVKVRLREAGKECHPHAHVILAFAKNLDLPEVYENDYSESAAHGYQKFSELEIFIQKVWRLLMDGERVTAKAIDELDIGYSCTCKRIEPNEDGGLPGAYEVFKYATKAFTSDKEKQLLDLQQFRTFKDVFAGERLLVGYGVFREFEDMTWEQMEAMKVADTIYDTYVENLNAREVSISTTSKFENVFLDMCCERPDWFYFSRKQMYDYARTAGLEALQAIAPENAHELMSKLEDRRRTLSDLHRIDRELYKQNKRLEELCRKSSSGRFTSWEERKFEANSYYADIPIIRKKIAELEELQHVHRVFDPDAWRTYQQRKGIAQDISAAINKDDDHNPHGDTMPF